MPVALSLLAMCGLLPHNSSFLFYRGVGNSKLPGMSQGPSLPTSRCHRPERMRAEAWEGVWEAEQQWAEGKENEVLSWGDKRQEDEERKMRGL